MTKTPEDVEKEIETVPKEVPLPENLAKEVKIVEGDKAAPKGRTFDKESWKPKTDLGKQVKNGNITNLKELFATEKKILEPEIVDILMPEAQTDLLLIGQSKGKFGGGARRIFRQTQKKTKEGNKPKFATCAVVGNMNGYVGVGYGKSKETVPAREKSLRKAKLNLMEIERGCGSWQCGCGKPHTVPFAVEGKCSSVEIKLIPAPVGTGLCIPTECAKILKLAGITDVWSKTKGQTSNRLNLIEAMLIAIRKISSTKMSDSQRKKLNITEGSSNG